jgi:hypothetical protein
VPPNLFDFAEGPALRCAISTVCEYRFRATKSVRSSLRDLPFGVRPLQLVSVDFVPPNLFDFAEGPALRCAISTEGECRFRATKSV